MRLDQLEVAARKQICRQLHDFLPAFQDTYEAGTIVPVLRANGKARIDVRVAALFFKRVLTDLRGVWLSISSGYTSQAASVAAALHENALATICLLHSDENIQELRDSENGEIPWSPMQMCKKVVSYWGHRPGTKDYENQWRAVYAQYVALCQSKHPTMQSVVHDTTASELGERGYVVMALPNVKEPDVPFKAIVCVQALQRTQEAIDAFASALGYPDDLPDDYKFAERVKRAKDTTWKAFEPFLKKEQPISIRGSWFTKKYPPVE